MDLKPGTRLASECCDTEVMIIKASPNGSVKCGGLDMCLASEKSGTSSSPEPSFSEGTLIGKRYVNEDQSLELLCVKAGIGSLSLDGVALVEKESKKLPSSD